MKPAVATLVEVLRRFLTDFPSDRAVGYGREDGTTGWLSSAELAERIRALSMGLQSLGVEPGDRVALLSENRWEWMAADFAILTAGAVTVPIHPGLTPAQVAYILNDSGARLAFTSGETMNTLMRRARKDASGVTAVVAFEATAAGDADLGLQGLLDSGRAFAERHPGRYRQRRDRVAPDDLASLIYTSGTTGDPKGVMLTHGNFASNVTACSSVFDFLPSDLALSFLPLCHVFQRTVDYCYYYSGCRVIHVPELSQVAASFTRYRPTTFAAVPRLYEKLYSRIQENVPDSRRRLFDWAVRQGVRVFRRRLEGRTVGPWAAMTRRLADRLVFRKIRERVGGNWRFANSGGAPLAADLNEFFNGVGLTVLEGYGLTETSPVIATNRMADPKPGTVGRPIAGVEVRIADDGEILTRGPHVMRGYWQAPDRTARVLDADGWLHTGDVGHLDADGYLSITDRKKEIIVTAQGKNIPPQPLENALKQIQLISQAVVVGDRRPYLAALIVPDFDVLRARSAELGLDGQSPEEMARAGSARAAIEKAIAELGARSAHHEQIRRFVLLPRELTQEEDELTPTLKLKRRVVAEHFKDQIEALYAGGERPDAVRA